MTIFDKSSKNEKFLLLILIAIIFLGGNYFGYRWLAQKQSSLQLVYLQLKADQAEAKVDLLESPTWAQRQAWIHDHQPAIGDEGGPRVSGGFLFHHPVLGGAFAHGAK